MTTDNGARPPEAPQDGDTIVDTGAAGGGTRETSQAGSDAEAMAKEVAELRDRWLRALAEMENLRRRTEREIAEARSYGMASFARDMLVVADNMQRALAAIPAELRDSVETGVKPFIEGVELTERELAKALEKHGIRRLEPMGQKFDPHVHQAMFEVPDTSVPTGTVVQVVQEGYTIGERVLRPALVGVSKGGPKVAASPPANENQEGDAATTAAVTDAGSDSSGT